MSAGRRLAPDPGLAAISLAREQLKVNCICYGLKAGVVGMKMIAAVVCRQILRGVSRVVRSCILIDQSIAGA